MAADRPLSAPEVLPPAFGSGRGPVAARHYFDVMLSRLRDPLAMYDWTVFALSAGREITTTYLLAEIRDGVWRAPGPEGGAEQWATS